MILNNRLESCHFIDFSHGFSEFSELATLRSRKAAVSSRFSRYPDTPTPRRQYKDREHPAELYTIDENPELITESAPLIILERKKDESTEPSLELLPGDTPKIVASSGEGEFPSPEERPSIGECPERDSSSDLLIVKIQESSEYVGFENDCSEHKFSSPPNVTRSVEAAFGELLEHHSSSHVLKGAQRKQSSHELLEKVSSTYVLRLEQSVQRTKTELQGSVGEEDLRYLESETAGHELGTLLNMDPMEPVLDGSETSEWEEEANIDDNS